MEIKRLEYHTTYDTTLLGSIQHLAPPDNTELMHKINEIIDHVNKLINDTAQSDNMAE